MNEERMKILELLGEGKINADEALELMKGLDYEQTSNDQTNSHSNNQSSNQTYGQSNSQSNKINFDWIRDLQTNIKDTLQDFSFDITDEGWFFGIGGRELIETTICSGDIHQDITSLKIVGKNASVEVISGHDKHIVIDASYRIRGSSEPRLVLEEENGNYRLSYDENAVTFMKLCVTVPSVNVKVLHVESKNAVVKISKVRFDRAYAVTKNAHIKLESLSGNTLVAETKNATVSLYDVTTKDIDISTTNAKIELECVTAQTADLQTTNGSIKTNGSEIKDIIAKTTNASVKLTPAMSTPGDYGIEVQTTNGGISVVLPIGEEIPCKIKASTTSGEIKTRTLPLSYSVKEKNYIEAKTLDNEQGQSNKHLSMMLRTTNSDIKIGS